MMKISIILLGIAVIILGIRINTLEHNVEAIKEWLKILGVIDLDSITEAVRKWQDEERDKE